MITKKCWLSDELLRVTNQSVVGEISLDKNMQSDRSERIKDMVICFIIYEIFVKIQGKLRDALRLSPIYKNIVEFLAESGHIRFAHQAFFIAVRRFSHSLPTCREINPHVAANSRLAR